MNYFMLFCVFFIGVLQADVTISTAANKTKVTIDQQLEVDVRLNYPTATPPDLFSFLYDLQTAPKTAFTLISSSVEKPQVQGSATSQSLHFRLAPTHTGQLIFAPGIIAFANQNYLVPALSVECASTELSSLPLAGLLPLYPERRIDLNPQNRLALLSEKVLQQARKDNEQSIRNYHLAWDGLAYLMAAVAFGVLVVWAIVYFELVERAKRPVKVVETPLQILVRQVQDKNLPTDIRWQKLAGALREALGETEAKNLKALGLFELADYVSASSRLTAADKELLLPAINTLGGIFYAAKPSTDEEFNQMQASMLMWMKKVQLN